jgi:hypothetical protein
MKYSGKEFGGFEPAINERVAELVKLIETKYISTPKDYRPIEFAHKAQYFALDVISSVGQGVPIGFLTEDKDLHQYIEINDGFMPVFNILVNMPWLSKVMQTWPLSAALPKDGDAVGFGRLITWVLTSRLPRCYLD